MTEDEAKAWLVTTFDVSRETWTRLEDYGRLLLEEGERQNLIAASTRNQLWSRHIADSAQLLQHVPESRGATWVDLGAGAGLPGVVVALLSGWKVNLVEARAKRIGFLRDIVSRLGLDATVHGCRVESLKLPAPARVISARAYAPLPKLLESAMRHAGRETIWLLPKGRNAEIELASVAPAWQKLFHVERSVTDPESCILIANGVATVRNKGKSA